MAARLSPTGNLLRSSRLFSLPPSLSPPAQPPTSSTVTESNTATLPYPIRAAIETPSSSLARGDWGLKRPLPSKSTTKSSLSPVVRVNRLDTFEHITDFESAADHVVTLKKWQELFMPISTRSSTNIPSSYGGGRHESVFENHYDNTYDSPNFKHENSKRFRFKGPWLPGQTEAEFQQFLKVVRRQKPGFLKFVRQRMNEKRISELQRKARDQGEDPPNLEAIPELSDAEFEEGIRSLRFNRTDLGHYISEFLDLAPSMVGNRGIWYSAPSTVSENEYAKFGPPKTHPSAGLSYIRTLAHLDNHPVAGPQTNRRPIQARLLRAKHRVKATTIRALVGVGGIVTETSSLGLRDVEKQTVSAGLIDPDVPGGVKFLIKPERAAINSQGEIDVKISAATGSSKELYGVAGKEKALPEQVLGKFREVPALDK